jgi:hypothetical protein
MIVRFPLQHLTLPLDFQVNLLLHPSLLLNPSINPFHPRLVHTRAVALEGAGNQNAVDAPQGEDERDDGTEDHVHVGWVQGF